MYIVIATDEESAEKQVKEKYKDISVICTEMKHELAIII